MSTDSSSPVYRIEVELSFPKLVVYCGSVVVSVVNVTPLVVLGSCVVRLVLDVVVVSNPPLSVVGM